MNMNKHIEQVQALNLAFAATEQKLTAEIAALTQREQEVTAQLLALRLQAEQEKTEQAAICSEQAHALQREHAEREQALTQQLQAGQEELRRLEQERVLREQEHAEQTHQARQELEALAHTLAQREQEVAAQLLALQQQAEQEKAEQARLHGEQAHAMRREHAEREQALNQQLQAGQQELRRLEQERVLREKDHAEQSSQARQELESLLRTQVQREQAVAEKLEREQEVLAQLLASQQQAAHEKAELLQRQQEDWAQLESALNNQIATLQNETQMLHQAQQLQAQQHGLEISTRLDEHTRLLEACAALEAQLQAEMQSGQQASLHLRQLLAEVQHSLEMTHTSLSWRMTAPLRKLASFITFKPPPNLTFPIVLEATYAIMPTTVDTQINAAQASAEHIMPASTGKTNSSHTPDKEMKKGVPHQAIMPSISESPPINVQHVSIESIMLTSAQATNPPVPALVSTMEELLACHDRQFVRRVYQTLLRREPDPEGLTYYLSRLRSGISKIEIIAQLCYSSEGQACNPQIPSLNTTLRRFKISRIPVFGKIYIYFTGVEGFCPVEKKLRIIENKLSRYNEQSNDRFDFLGQTLNNLHLILCDVSEQISGIRLESSNKTLGDINSDISQNSIDKKNITPPSHASDVLAELSKSIIYKRV